MDPRIRIRIKIKRIRNTASKNRLVRLHQLGILVTDSASHYSYLKRTNNLYLWIRSDGLLGLEVHPNCTTEEKEQLRKWVLKHKEIDRVVKMFCFAFMLGYFKLIKGAVEKWSYYIHVSNLTRRYDTFYVWITI